MVVDFDKPIMAQIGPIPAHLNIRSGSYQAFLYVTRSLKSEVSRSKRGRANWTCLQPQVKLICNKAEVSRLLGHFYECTLSGGGLQPAPCHPPLSDGKELAGATIEEEARSFPKEHDSCSYRDKRVQMFDKQWASNKINSYCLGFNVL